MWGAGLSIRRPRQGGCQERGTVIWLLDTYINIFFRRKKKRKRQKHFPQSIRILEIADICLEIILAEMGVMASLKKVLGPSPHRGKVRDKVKGTSLFPGRSTKCFPGNKVTIDNNGENSQN